MQINAWKDHGAPQVSGGVHAAGGPPRRPEDRTDSGGQAHRAGPRGGGLMVQAMKQTLDQMGLVPAGSAEAPDTGAGTSSSTDRLDSSTLREDMHALMHALFHAIRASSADSGADTADGSTAERGPRSQSGSPAGPPPDLASALGSLATQAANGQAPSELQEAFQKLVQDLQGSSGDGSGDGSTATLQAFLQTLQQNLGPAVVPELPSTGQSLQVQA